MDATEISAGNIQNNSERGGKKKGERDFDPKRLNGPTTTCTLQIR